MNIRIATSDDAAALAALNDEFNATVTTAEDVRRRFGQTGSRELVCIAIKDELAVGFACAQVYHSICYERPAAELTEIYVRSGYRSQGIGKALVAHIESDLIARQVNEMRIETNMANEMAKKLYLSSGYIPLEHQIFAKKLG